MDLDGSWKPPESWPESSPPLPGWTRAVDGSWQAPNENLSDVLVDVELEAAEAAHAAAELDETEEQAPPTRPIPETASTPATPPTAAPVTPATPAIPAPRSTPEPAAPEPTKTVAAQSTLQFSGTEAVVVPFEDDGWMTKKAIRAGFISVVLAAMISTGLILLLLAIL